jgi:predicted phage-related endonuclease
MWYLSLTGCEEAHVAVLIGNSELRIYCIRRDIEIEHLLTEAALKFWNEHVLTGIPPKVMTRGDTLCLFDKAAAGKKINADDRLLTQLRRLSKLQSGIAALTAESEQIKDEITCAMGDAEAITSRGKTIATWKNVRPAARIDVTRMKSERPDLVAQYSLMSAPTRRFVLE